MKNLIVLLLLLSGLSSAFSQPIISFNDIVIGLEGSIEFVKGADMDGDGDQDMVVYYGNSAWWYENTGLGNIFPKHQISGSILSGFDVADFDKDGAPDVIVSKLSQNLIEIYLNDGSGVSYKDTLRFNNLSIYSIDADDWDMDGDMDFIAEYGIDIFNTEIRFFPQNSSGGFDLSDSKKITERQREYFAKGDLNGDNIPDFVVPDGSKLNIATNNGDGTFTISTYSNPPNFYYLDIMDVDFDGLGDIVIMDFQSANFDWLKNTGSGFTPQTITIDESANELDLIDFDKDNDMDLLSYDDLFGEMFIQINDGNFNFNETRVNTTKDYEFVNGRIDFDGDGLDELIKVTNFNQGISALKFSKPVGTKNLIFQDDLKVSPNPSSNLISVDLPNEMFVKKLEFYDINGSLIKRVEYASYVDKIISNCSDLENGSYILLVEGNNKTFRTIFQKN